ncbi:MAG: amidohydrolase family protein [Dehalococcoidales bacterium]|nr:amidohydrolase family protein [Dehalococcoidales bacterium]
MLADNKVVDVHYHVVSPKLAKEISGCVPVPDIFRPEQLTTEEEQLETAEKNGVHILWVSSRTLRHYVGPKEVPASSPHVLTVARVTNDYLASVCQRYPGRFMAFADIPLAYGDAAIIEMRRGLTGLGLHGICLQTNYDGKPLDAPEFEPFFNEANRLKAVIHVHPIAPRVAEEAFQGSSAASSVLGFTYDTTLTFIRLAYAGVLERYPDLTFILSHAGGTIPFLWWRINMPYDGNRPGTRDHIKYPPTSYLERCYYDTALTDTETLMFTRRRVGDHLMFGTDRPYGPRDGLQHSLKSVRAMRIPEETKAKIMSGNALALSRRSLPE